MAAEPAPTLSTLLGALTESPLQWLDVPHGDDLLLGLSFALAVASRRRPWRAQLMQDAFVLSVLGFPENGSFVEIGVGDGLTLSNSAVLESDYGWTGLLVEPNTHFQAEIRVNRPDTPLVRKAVLAEADGYLPFRHIPHFGEISSLEKYASSDHHDRSAFEASLVETVGAADLLEAENVSRNLDYLSIDIEGPDAEVLEAILQAGWRPKIITVEHNFSEASVSKLREMLATEYNIALEQSSKWDFWAIRRDIYDTTIARLRSTQSGRAETAAHSLSAEPAHASESPAKQLIVDVGMHTGEDTDFYLQKGFDVIAIEANPQLCEAAHLRFAREIASGQLRILNLGVMDKTDKLPFYINNTYSQFSSFDPDAGRRFGNFHIIGVETRRLSSILARQQTPHYVKISIETATMAALLDLMQYRIYPRFLSVQNGTAETVRLLAANGYNAFKWINQAEIPSFHPPEEALEGHYVSYDFQAGSGGPFGEETVGSWLSEEEVTGVINAYWQTPGLNPGKHGWFDLHARHRCATSTRQ